MGTSSHIYSSLLYLPPFANRSKLFHKIAHNIMVSKMSHSISAKFRETTAFHQWRQQVNLSVGQAAVLLGKTRQMVRYLDAGRTNDGRRVVPLLDTRRLMSAVARGIDLAPWPI